MAMLRLDTLPITGKYLDLPTVIETAGNTGILVDNKDRHIVSIEREDGEYIDIETDSPENAKAVFNEIHYLVRLTHAEWVDISELPGFARTTTIPMVVKKKTFARSNS